MIVKSYYEGGRIDVFDTDHMTEALPQKGNLLTNYSLVRQDDSVWLTSYYYETSEAFRDTAGPEGPPVARRRDGWSFLIADESDMSRLLRMTADDETILMRVAGELVDVATLHCVYDAYEDVAPMVTVAHDHILRQIEGIDNADVEQDSCERIGITINAFRSIIMQLDAKR